MSKQKPGKGDKGDNSRGTFRRTFRFPLTVEQRAARAEKQAVLVGEIEGTEGERKAVAKELGDKLKRLRAHLHAVARTVRLGAEERQVDCTVRKHPKRPVMQLVRLDTGEVFDERPMSAEELQVSFGDKWDAFVTSLAQAAASPEPPSEEPQAPEPKRKAAKITTCSAPEPGNDSGVCDADGDEKRQGFCVWHVEKYSDDERKAIVRARKAADKKAAQAAPPADANGQANGTSNPDKQQREQLGSDAQRCLDCNEFPCVCDARPGEDRPGSPPVN